MSDKESGPRLSPAQMVRPDYKADKAEISQNKGSEDLREAYRYVLTDLRRIAIIAVIMLVLMIVLAVVLV